MFIPLMLLVFCVILAVAVADSESTVDTVVPRPYRVTATGGGFSVTPATRFCASDAQSLAVAGMLARPLRRATGFELPVTPMTETAPGNAIILTRADADAGLGNEGYTLESNPDAVTIRSRGDAGLFYGLQTLRQLLPAAIEDQSGRYTGEICVPGVSIWDKPRFPVRTFMLDSCRHMQSVTYIKRTIDQLAHHKINTLHWHLTEDQGWRIEIKKYPKLALTGAWRGAGEDRYGGFYTQAQIRDVVKYAAERFINIIPEFDIPGHTVAALAAYPELGCTGGPYRVRREWGIAEDVLCVGKESTFQFVEDVISEMLDLFPSKVFHIGGDECPRTRWKDCPHCQALIKREGLSDEDAIQNYFTRRVMRFLAEHGRRLQGWNEIMTGGELPQDVIVHQWNWPYAGEEAAKAGNDVVYSMSTWLYFDHDIQATPLSRVYQCEPVPEGLNEEQVARILGPEACLWTEYLPTEIAADEFAWPRVVAMAEVAWTARDRRDWNSFANRMLHGHYQRLVKMGLGVSAQPPNDLFTSLVARSGFEPGTRVGDWKPGQVSTAVTTLEWDISEHIHGSGPFSATFLYEDGLQGLITESASAVQNGEVVFVDEHPGWSGVRKSGHMYLLRLPGWSAGDRVTLRATVRCDAGNDSTGSVWLRA